MKLLAVLGAAAALSLPLANGAMAHYVVKSLSCIPVGASNGQPYSIDCHVSAVFGTVRNDCVCAEGFSLYNPDTPLKLGDGEGTASGVKGPRNATNG